MFKDILFKCLLYLKEYSKCTLDVNVADYGDYGR